MGKEVERNVLAAAAGLELKKSDGSLDRRALGELLFKNPNLLAKQESLVYPAFERRIQEMIDASKNAQQAQDGGGAAQPMTVGQPAADFSANQKACVDQNAGGGNFGLEKNRGPSNACGLANAGGFVINATLLYKTPALLRQCQKIIYVDAPLLVRVWRSRRRDKMPLLQIFRRIKSQRGLYAQYKKFAADYGIEMVKTTSDGGGF